MKYPSEGPSQAGFFGPNQFVKRKRPGGRHGRRQFQPVVTALENRLLLSLTTLASFNGTNGAGPNAGVTLDANGDLFGTTDAPNASSEGTVWEIANGSSTITTLAFFDGTDGGVPNGVTLDANGNLFGTAAEDGAYGDGTVWEIANGTGAITTLASFNGTNGAGPAGGVTLDSNGNLFGTAGGGAYGDGTVWEIANGSGTITTLASFNITNGWAPYGGVTFDANGNLFGTTGAGGTNDQGTVWEIANGSKTITTIASFNGTNGANPEGGVSIDASGNLFGTAAGGGAYGYGTVWEIANGSGTITTLASFDDLSNGDLPQAGVTLDANDDLFGTTEEGPAVGNGTVWELANGSGTITNLASFNGTNGAGPTAGVTFDANGDLFGTTSQGGANSDGTVFEIGAPVTVVAVDTTTTLQSSENPSEFGDSVTFTATVTPANDTNGTPTGSVQFSIDGAISGDPVPLDDNGDATLTTSTLAVGSHTITANYINADDYFNPSSGTLIGGQIVTTADTTVAVSSNASPSVFGQSVTLTAVVAALTPGLPVPTGTVEFFDSSTELGTATLDGTGSAFVQHVRAGSGAALHHGPVPGRPKLQHQHLVSLAPVRQPGQHGDQRLVEFFCLGLRTAGDLHSERRRGRSGAGTPTGTVTFQEGSTILDIETLGGNGTVSFTTSALPVGPNSIIAVYSGDSNFVTSSSTTSQTVNEASTSTSATANPSSSVFGQSVTFTASVGVVVPGAGTPTGTVTFQEGSTVLDTGTLGASGTVSFTTSALPVGSNSITATYSGDPNFVTSSSSATSFVVSQASTTTGLSATPSTTTEGQPVTLTATIAAVAPGAGTPTGSVQFFVGTTSLGTASLSGTTAILTTTTLPVGTDSLTAQYLGDSNFTGSTSSAVVVTVNAEHCHDHDPYLLDESFGLRPVGHLDRDGSARLRQRHAHGKRDLLRRLDGAWHRDAQRQESNPQDNVGTRRFAGHHRGLQRGHQLCPQHLRGPDSDGEPGLDNDQSDFLGESVGLRAVGDVHGDGEGGLARKRDADGHGDVLRRHDRSRQRNPERGQRDHHDHIRTSNLAELALDHGRLQRRHQFHHQHLGGADRKRSTRIARRPAVASSLNPSVYGQQ